MPGGRFLQEARQRAPQKGKLNKLYSVFRQNKVACHGKANCQLCGIRSLPLEHSRNLCVLTAHTIEACNMSFTMQEGYVMWACSQKRDCTVGRCSIRNIESRFLGC